MPRELKVRRTVRSPAGRDSPPGLATTKPRKVCTSAPRASSRPLCKKPVLPGPKSNRNRNRIRTCCCWPRLKRHNFLAHKLDKFFARQRQITRWHDRFAEVHLHLAQARNRMEPSGFGRDQLHVVEEHRNDWHARL